MCINSRGGRLRSTYPPCWELLRGASRGWPCPPVSILCWRKQRFQRACSAQPMPRSGLARQQGLRHELHMSKHQVVLRFMFVKARQNEV